MRRIRKKNLVGPRTVMVFGTFDRLHPGHLFFLEKARRLGDKLIVVIARDRIVKILKDRVPQQSETSRRAAVRRTGLADCVVLGDAKLEAYGVVKKFRPVVIALGYDQQALAKNLRLCLPRLCLGYSLRFRRIASYKPRTFKSSLLAC